MWQIPGELERGRGAYITNIYIYVVHTKVCQRLLVAFASGVPRVCYIAIYILLLLLYSSRRRKAVEGQFSQSRILRIGFWV